ncbi:hypothetical protein CEP52_017811, partial [Fusarium oligoseptatum]
AAGFLADLDKAAALRGRHDDIPEDFLSVSSGSSTPLLPGNEDSDDEKVEPRIVVAGIPIPVPQSRARD